MVYTSPHELFQDELPPSIRSNFVPIISRAYQMTEQLVKQHDFLQWAVGEDITPIIRRIIIEHQFKKMVDSGLLGIEYRVAPNKIDNCCHIELITKSNGIITISQVRHYKDMPRRACFRNNLSSNNCYFQQSLFEDENSRIMEEFKKQQEYGQHYILLTHGYGESLPNFVYIGMPEPNMKGWVQNTRIDLLKEPTKLINFNDTGDNEEELLVEIKEELRGQGEGQSG